MLLLFCLSKANIKGTGLKAVYVGNPLQEYIQSHLYQEDWKKEVGIPEGVPCVALFPGSRLGEVQRNLPAILEAAEMLKKSHDRVCFALSLAHSGTKAIALELLAKTSLQQGRDVFFVPKALAYEMMRDSRCAIAKSGTITLELALHRCPTVVVYKLTLINRLFAKYVLGLKLPYYSLANILAEKEIFPELIEKGFSSGNIFESLKLMFEDSPQRKVCLEGCQEIIKLLNSNQAQPKSASHAAAIQIEELLSC